MKLPGRERTLGDVDGLVLGHVAQDERVVDGVLLDHAEGDGAIQQEADLAAARVAVGGVAGAGACTQVARWSVHAGKLSADDWLQALAECLAAIRPVLCLVGNGGEWGCRLPGSLPMVTMVCPLPVPGSVPRKGLVETASIAKKCQAHCALERAQGLRATAPKPRSDAAMQQFGLLAYIIDSYSYGRSIMRAA